MPRPADWCLLDLANDPTPGEPSAVIALSLRVSRIAEDATRAERGVRGLAANSAVTTWIGAAGDVFRGALDDFPVQLRKLADSYDQCARALSTYAGALEAAQDQADRALAQGRLAKSEIDALRVQLAGARSSASTAENALDGLSRSSVDGSPAPDPWLGVRRVKPASGR